MNADETFEKIVNEALDKLLANNPDMATSLGLHDPYDYFLPNASTEQILADLKLMEQAVEKLKASVNRDELNDQHKIDFEVLENALEQWKFRIYEQRTHELDPDALSQIGGLIFIMLTRNYAPLEKRIDAIASRIEKTPKFLEEFRSRFEHSRPVKLWTEMAIEAAQNMQGLFMFVLHATKGRVSEEVYAKLSKAVENLQPALLTHMKWLQDISQKTVEEFALGKEKFEKLIQLRNLGMSSEEILQLGTKYLNDLKIEREKLAQQIASGKSVDEVMKIIGKNSPSTFEEALEYTRRIMEEARKFVQEKKIATVYDEDVLLVEETPAFLAPVIPFAAMMMPAKFDKPQIGVYIVTRPKDPSNLGKHLNYYAVRNTATHEAFPGHFLQGAISNRGSLIPLFAYGTETVEGWAHYCEQMMAEKGFTNDLETQLIRVNDMIWRAVRIIVDVKLSRGEMSFDEAVQMLVNETGMSKEGATAEVKRYTQTPGYPLSYLLGKHLILKLKEEQMQKLGSRFDEKEFHDTITANGYLPISLLRKVFD
ncbi:MAG: DUF885 domain-containing protein, partial [Candidatus Bathyarchaeia archaeon]